MDKRKVWRLSLAAITTVCILLLLLSGCSNSQNDEATADMAASGEDSSNKKSAQTQDGMESAEDASESKEKTESGATEQQTGMAEMRNGAYNQKLIYRGNVTMEVKNYAKADTEIRDRVMLNGGYILQFKDSESSYEVGGSYTIKVPSRGFFSFVNSLRTLKPTRFQRSLEGQDVTEEYVDLESRLKAKQVVEARLLSFMEKATKTDDLVAFSDKLATVQEEIEQIRGRMRYLDQNVEFSTIELRVYEPPKVEGAVEKEDDAMFTSKAWKAMISSFKVVGLVLEGLLIFLFGALPVLLLLALVAVPVVYFVRKKRINLPKKIEEADVNLMNETSRDAIPEPSEKETE